MGARNVSRQTCATLIAGISCVHLCACCRVSGHDGGPLDSTSPSLPSVFRALAVLRDIEASDAISDALAVLLS